MVENRLYPDGTNPRYIATPIQYGKEFPSECRVFSVNFKKLDPEATSPTRNHTTDAGMDLYSLENVIVPSLFKLISKFIMNEISLKLNSLLIQMNFRNLSSVVKYEDDEILATKVKTGIALEIPQGMYGLILDRSSMGSKLLKGLAGVIDSGYRGDVTVCLANLSFRDYHIKAGDKVAQIVFHKYEALQPVEVDELAAADRGEKGFGSSGA